MISLGEWSALTYYLGTRKWKEKNKEGRIYPPKLQTSVKPWCGMNWFIVSKAPVRKQEVTFIEWWPKMAIKILLVVISLLITTKLCMGAAACHCLCKEQQLFRVNQRVRRLVGRHTAWWINPSHFCWSRKHNAKPLLYPNTPTPNNESCHLQYQLKKADITAFLSKQDQQN